MAKDRINFSSSYLDSISQFNKVRTLKANIFACGQHFEITKHVYMYACHITYSKELLKTDICISIPCHLSNTLTI